MVIVSLWPLSRISRIRRVIVLPVDIHETIKSSRSTRHVETNPEFNPHLVTNCLLVDRRDHSPPCSKSTLIFKSKAICKMMGIASCKTWQISEVRNEESVAAVARDWVTFEGVPVLIKAECSSGKDSEMPNEASIARIVSTKSFSTVS